MGSSFAPRISFTPQAQRPVHSKKLRVVKSEMRSSSYRTVKKDLSSPPALDWDDFSGSMDYEDEGAELVREAESDKGAELVKEVESVASVRENDVTVEEMEETNEEKMTVDV